jgi:cytochrome c oxidase subunit IV
MAMEQAEAVGGGETEHIVPYGTFVKVWIALLGLTALLVLMSKLARDPLAVWGLLTVTPLKAGLVFYYFMHLKYERTLFKGMLAIALGALIIFLALLFSDISYR